MFSLFCLLASLAILFYVIRFRVHVHVEYTPTSSRTPSVARKPLNESGKVRVRSTHRQPLVARHSGEEFVPVASNLPGRNSGPMLEPQSARVSDISSALVNLGAAKGPSWQAAKQAVREHPDASFDIQFSVALREVRSAA